MAWADDVAGRQRPGKAAIMRAAVSVIGEQGYEGASVRDMASRAGVSVAALYYHFPSKRDLLREYLEEAWQVLLSRLDRRLRAVDDDPFAQLDEYVSTLIATQLHDDYAKVASNVALREHGRLPQPERGVVRQLQDRLQTMLERIVEQGVAAGSFVTADVHATSLGIVTLATSVSRTLASEGRSMQEVIVAVQRMARSLVCGAPSGAIASTRSAG
jgi:AcrR family transcriptional regulator